MKFLKLIGLYTCPLIGLAFLGKHVPPHLFLSMSVTSVLLTYALLLAVAVFRRDYAASTLQVGRLHESHFVVSCWHHGLQFDLWTVDVTRAYL